MFYNHLQLQLLQLFTNPVPLSMTQAGCRPVILKLKKTSSKLSSFCLGSQDGFPKRRESTVAEAFRDPNNQDGDLPTAHPRALWEKSEVWCGNKNWLGWAREKLFPFFSSFLWTPRPTKVDKRS